MATFVSLLNWTEKGIKDFKDTVNRAHAAAELAEKMGGKLKDIYWTIGPHDAVAIVEFPDPETATAYLLNLGALGNVRTTSLRAFSEQEMVGIIAKAG